MSARDRQRKRFSAVACSGGSPEGLGILSGATGKFSPELKARHPNLKLRHMVDFRNARAYGYLNVDANIVWDVIVSYLPEVLAKAKRLAIRGDGVGSEKRTWILHHSRFSRCVVG